MGEVWGKVELLRLAARVDQGGERVHAGLQPAPHHLVVELEGARQLLRLAARVDEDVVRDLQRTEAKTASTSVSGTRPA